MSEVNQAGNMMMIFSCREKNTAPKAATTSLKPRYGERKERRKVENKEKRNEETLVCH